MCRPGHEKCHEPDPDLSRVVRRIVQDFNGDVSAFYDSINQTVEGENTAHADDLAVAERIAKVLKSS